VFEESKSEQTNLYLDNQKQEGYSMTLLSHYIGNENCIHVQGYILEMRRTNIDL
jgi:hypothetical protein